MATAPNYDLVIIRHGQSEANKENIFTGWRDSPLSPAGIEEAIPLFLETTREDLENLACFLNEQDYSGIRYIGHDLKGSGGGYGFDPISEIGRTLEEAAKRSDRDEISRQIAALTDYLDRVDVVFD